MEEKLSGNPPITVFICTRSKDKGESCGPKGSAELRDHLKGWVKTAGLSPKVKVIASLCLGHCENGITMCVQPENRWFLKIDAQKDVEQIQQQIIELAAAL
ncbi:MAG: (2Fe-2S) ferredoxin domain-containing protein [Bdellovibrionales bacterium]|nr:(2Fe-2S) ferredoxin domain-containing protein [Bdellovibrionales bacterium]